MQKKYLNINIKKIIKLYKTLIQTKTYGLKKFKHYQIITQYTTSKFKNKIKKFTFTNKFNKKEKS